MAVDFDLRDPLNCLLLGLVSILLIIQLWLVLKNSLVKGRERRVRLFLNLILWIITLGFVLQPFWKETSSARNILITGNEVPKNVVKHLKDSLGIHEATKQGDFTAKHYDTITVLGQDFKPEFFADLSMSGQKFIRWIPWFKPNDIQQITWHAVLSKGSMQDIRGELHSSDNQRLRLRYGNRTLDSTELKKGFNSFNLKFPVFAQGRIAATIDLAGKAIDTIRFYSRPAQPKTYRFVLGSPDFESRTLAEWLGKNGHSVILSSTLSKNILNSKIINKTGEPDVYITDPANFTDPVIKKAIKNNKSVLLIGVNQPDQDFALINRALGSKWSATKIAGKENIPVTSELTALPYRFVSSAGSYDIPEIPVAISRFNSKIEISLLNETYPLVLSGDTVAYDKVWSSILAEITPADTNNMAVTGPVFKGIKSSFEFNHMVSDAAMVLIGNGVGGDRSLADTLFMNHSQLNGKTFHNNYLPSNSGDWVPLGVPYSNTEIFVEEEQSFKSVRQAQYLSSFVKIYQGSGKSYIRGKSEIGEFIKKRIPGYVWFLLFLISLPAIWLYEKISSGSSSFGK